MKCQKPCVYQCTMYQVQSIYLVTLYHCFLPRHSHQRGQAPAPAHSRVAQHRSDTNTSL